MIFLISKLPFEAVQLQNHLKAATQQQIDIYLSVEEAEANLYKVPDVIVLDDNLGLTNLLYLTQSVKIYDSSIEVVWLCKEDYKELEGLQKSYGAFKCLSKDGTSLELLSFTLLEICNQQEEDQRQKRKEYLKKNLLSCLL